MCLDGWETTIFLISSDILIIQNEMIEFRHGLRCRAALGSREREVWLVNFAQAQNISVKPDLVDRLVLSFKGLSEFWISQDSNLAYQSNGEINDADLAVVRREKEQVIKSPDG